jgi:hypothetical protein
MTISSGVLCFPYLAKRWAVARPIRVRSHRNYLRSCAAFLLARALLFLHFPCHDPLPSSLCILCVTIRCTTSLGRASPACVPASPSTTCHGHGRNIDFDHACIIVLAHFARPRASLRRPALLLGCGDLAIICTVPLRRQCAAFQPFWLLIGLYPSSHLRFACT